MRRLALIVCLLVAGCGDDGAAESGSAAPAASNRLVDTSAKPPLVNALEVDPQSGEYLLTTNKGFWRIDPKTDKVTEVRSTVTGGSAASPVGTFLFLYHTPDGRLLGSGHPDDQNLPQYLGFLESEDGGKSWTVTSRLGEADLHKMVFKHNKLYAWDAVLSALLVTEDGQRFKEHFTPRGLVIDFDVSPSDPDLIVASTEEELFLSDDGGEGWRPVDRGPGIRLAWTEQNKLYRADADGTFSVSADGGRTFGQVGKLPGEPYKIRPLGPEELAVALADGTIVRSADGGKSWDVEFKP